MYYSSSDNSDSELTRQKNTALDLSYLMLDVNSIGGHLKENIAYNGSKDETSAENSIEKLFIEHNILIVLPHELTLFANLKVLNISNNNLLELSSFIGCLVHLQTLNAKNNSLTENTICKSIADLTKLKDLNLSGNKLTIIPPYLYKLHSLKYLYLGNNEINEISQDIKCLDKLQVLHLGGNQLVTIPDEVGLLSNLGMLSLCDNRLRRLPRVISKLYNLQSLYLQNNNLCCLPVEIVKLKSLREVSLRDNPLVAKFVDCCAKKIINKPPSLLESAARQIKLSNIKYETGDIPYTLEDYLETGQKCVNPKCKGVYFTACYEHIKFVDFCGKYRVPLLHYLCSTKCKSTTPTYYGKSDDSSDSDGTSTLKKVLLG